MKWLGQLLINQKHLEFILNCCFPRIPFLNRLHLYLNSSLPIIWAGDHNLTQDAKIDRYPLRLENDMGCKEFLHMMNVFNLKDACRT